MADELRENSASEPASTTSEPPSRWLVATLAGLVEHAKCARRELAWHLKFASQNLSPEARATLLREIGLTEPIAQRLVAEADAFTAPMGGGPLAPERSR